MDIATSETFTIKNAHNFCTASNAMTCYEADPADPNNGVIYTVCYQCATLVIGEPCTPTLCCDHPDQITAITGTEQRYEINPEDSLWPDPTSQDTSTDIREIFWSYTNFAICQSHFTYSM